MNNEKNKIVSIICPCYNHEKYVKDLIKSLLNQTYTNLELIFTDDCSTDNTYNTLLDLQLKLKEKFVHTNIYKNQNNLGLVKTVNNMINISHGEYIKIIASDDFLDEKYIEKCVKFMEDNQNYNFMFTDYYVMDEKCTFENKKYIFKSNLSLYKNKNLYDELYKGNWLPAPTAFFRKIFFDLYGLYNENYLVEDYPKWLQVLKYENPGFLYEFLVYYRVLKHSLSHGIKLYDEITSEKHIKLWLDLIKNYEKYVENPICKKYGSSDKIARAYIYSILGSNYKYIEEINKIRKEYKIKITFKKIVKIFMVILCKKILYAGS